MGKMIFTHGVMSSGKSSILIQKAFQFNECGRKVEVIRPIIDTRTEQDKVESRIGIEWDATAICPSDSITEFHASIPKYDVLLVDEAQFFTPEQIEELASIADSGILVIAFGLLTDFEGRLFDGSKRLVELSDRLDELPSMCECGKKATMHVRLTAETDQIVCGDDIYKSVCRKCFVKYKGL